MERNVSTFEFANGRTLTTLTDPRSGRISYETVIERPLNRMEAPDQTVVDAIAKAACLKQLETPTVPEPRA